MKIAPLLCAIWVCAPLALQATLAGSPDRGPLEAVTDRSRATGQTGAGRDTTIKARGEEPPELAGAGKGGFSKGRNATAVDSRHGGSVTSKNTQLARNNANHAPLMPGARAGIVNASRSVGSSHASLGNGSTGRMGSAGPTRTERIAASSARTASSLGAAPKGSMIGGPRAAGSARMGGPSSARVQNRAAIDGAKLYRKP